MHIRQWTPFAWANLWSETDPALVVGDEGRLHGGNDEMLEMSLWHEVHKVAFVKLVPQPLFSRVLFHSLSSFWFCCIDNSFDVH